MPSIKSKIKILHLIDSFDAGGAQESLSILLKYFDKEKYEIHCACLHGHGVFEERIRESGVQVYSVSKSKWNPFLLLQLFFLFRRLQPQILHCHLVVSNCFGQWMKTLAKVPIRVIHARSENPFRIQQQNWSKWDAQSSRKADTAIAVSKQVAQFLIQTQGLEPARVKVIHNAPDLESLMNQKSEAKGKLRQLFGLPEELPIIGTACRLDPNKGCIELLEATAELLKKGLKFHLAIAGEGPFREDIEAKIKALQLDPHVSLLGFIPREEKGDRHLIQFMKVLDLFVLASYLEGFPVSVLEAMALSKPVIATPVSGLEGNFEHQNELYFTKIRDSKDLEQQIEALLLATDEEKQQLGQRAKEKVINTFHPNITCEAISNCYQELLQARG